ncbi:MAG: C39 family peptidase [Fidelibacterota bacterium]
MKNCFFTILIFTATVFADTYPDQHFEYRDIKDLFDNAVEIENIVFNNVDEAIQLAEDATTGSIIFASDSADYPFNEGLPSWNGFAPRQEQSAFAVQMRFPYGNGWSPWVTVGFWKDFIWSSYGNTSWNGGKVNIDEVELFSYVNKWQFKILMKRSNTSLATPKINKLSFFASDSRTTGAFDLLTVLGDNPEPIFINTEFYYQYGLDEEIGGSICSPTSVAMILRSYDIEVEPVQFARDTKDPKYGIFGVWPRVVQNASEFGLDGAVTRYRNWSEPREVLANGGRIAISVGQPLYTGHLMMLAGFTDNGKPIIHDPAQSDGYSYIFDKSALSRSWFEKGGVSYTFYLKDSLPVTSIDQQYEGKPEKLSILSNYPNPFNGITKIKFILDKQQAVSISVYDIRGNCVFDRQYSQLDKGIHTLTWNPEESQGEKLSTGIYVARFKTENNRYSTNMIYLK